jgi:hypothetical protein
MGVHRKQKESFPFHKTFLPAITQFLPRKNSSNAQKELKKNSACNHFQALEREGEHIIEGEKGKSFVGGQIYLLNKWEWTDQP